MEKHSFSLKLLSGDFYGHSFIKTVRDPFTIAKNNSLLFFFCAVYHSKNHMIPHPVIASILNVILKFYTAENNNMPVQIQPALCCYENYQKIVIHCDVDSMLNFALTWWQSWTPC